MNMEHFLKPTSNLFLSHYAINGQDLHGASLLTITCTMWGNQLIDWSTWVKHHMNVDLLPQIWEPYQEINIGHGIKDTDCSSKKFSSYGFHLYKILVNNPSFGPNEGNSKYLSNP